MNNIGSERDIKGVAGERKRETEGWREREREMVRDGERVTG